MPIRHTCYSSDGVLQVLWFEEKCLGVDCTNPQGRCFSRAALETLWNLKLTWQKRKDQELFVFSQDVSDRGLLLTHVLALSMNAVVQFLAQCEQIPFTKQFLIAAARVENRGKRFVERLLDGEVLGGTRDVGGPGILGQIEGGAHSVIDADHQHCGPLFVRLLPEMIQLLILEILDGEDFHFGFGKIHDRQDVGVRNTTSCRALRHGIVSIRAENAAELDHSGKLMVACARLLLKPMDFFAKTAKKQKTKKQPVPNIERKGERESY